MAKSHFILILILLFNIIISVPSVVLLRNRQNQNTNNNNNNNGFHSRPVLQGGGGGNGSSCSLFSGSWVHDDSYPLYQYSNCPVIDPQFNCQLYGRPDTNYLNYRWQPANCQIPRLNGAELLTRMKGKSVMFVGDSLGRNQWESLICMMMASSSSPGATEYARGDPMSTWRFLEYGVTVSFYKAPYLVDIDAVGGKRVLRLGEIRGNGNAWRGFDVVSFNTGHWWAHRGGLQGWDLVEDTDGTMYADMDRLVAMEKGLRTWARWVDANIDATKTALFFQSFSPTHYNPSEWNTGDVTSSKSCYGETMPMTGMSGNPATYSDQMTVLQEVLGSMYKPPFLLDITMLSAMRKDAHPSIYNGDLTPEQRANPDHSADCSHWCLPGLPDTWNQLFYTALFFH